MRVSAALSLVLIAALARAGDPPAGGDSISEAKKDLASIKGQAGPQDPGAALPTLELKDIGPVPSAPAPLPVADPESASSAERTKKQGGTGNWLVDAMDRNAAESRSQRDKDRGRGDRDLLKLDGELKAPDAKGDLDERLNPAERDRPSEEEHVSGAYNPLDSFMGGWISAKDHDLLLPSAKGGPGAAREHADLIPGLGTGAAEDPVSAMLEPQEPAGFADAKGVENPYLAAIDLSPSRPARTFLNSEDNGPPSGLPDFSRGISTNGVSDRPFDASRSAIPDFAQPSDDDKYFKQLKRF